MHAFYDKLQVEKNLKSFSKSNSHSFKFFSIRFLVYWISLPQKRVYWWTVLGSVKFYLQICLQFLFWCQIRGHIKSALSLLFFSPSDCVRLLFVLSVPFSIANQVFYSTKFGFGSEVCSSSSEINCSSSSRDLKNKSTRLGWRASIQ